MNERLIELQKKISSEFSSSSFKVGRPEKEFESMVFIYQCQSSKHYQNFDVIKEFFSTWNSKIDNNTEFSDVSVESFEVEGPMSICLNSEDINNCVIIRLSFSLLSDKAMKLLGELP